MDALDRACDYFKNQDGLAAALRIRSPSISGWRKRGVVPLERCIEIEALTNGAVTCEQLRPNFSWPRTVAQPESTGTRPQA